MSTVEGIDLRRRWLAITLATVVLQFAYWPIVFSPVARDDGEMVALSGIIWFGVAVVPFAFMALAFLSRHERAASATLKAMGLFVLVAPPVMLLDVPVGVVAGLTAGGVVALRRDEVHSLKARWIAVGAAAVYMLVLRVVAVEFALMSGAVLPFTVHGLVDQAVETR